MLICSYCQFENPYSNKFCQNCGSPLTLLLAIVTLSAAQAGNNAAECAEPPAPTAAIEPLPPASTDAPQPSAGEPKPNHAGEVGASLNSTLETATLSQAEAASSFAEGPTPDSLTVEAIEPMGKASDSAAQTLEPILSLPTPTLPPELTKSYLDSKQRYQVQQPLSPTTFSHLELEAEVIDAHPAEPRPLAKTEERLVELAEETDEAEAVDTVLSAALPASAQPYLLLQSSFFPAIPELHSAWQTQDYSVLIVEHRGHLPKLFDYWRTEASEPLQQVHWCYEMAELWQVLEPHQGQPSLLNIENLRIDEDQVLCLQRLYFQSAEMRYTLRDLGLLWQIMLQQVPDALSDLVTLASDLGSGQLETIETLQARLVAIADGVLQSDEATAANLSPDLEAAASAMPSGGEVVGAEAASISALSPLIETDLDLEETLGLEAESLTNDSPTMVLPMMLVELEDAGLTHVGQQREHNEDTFCIQSQSQRLATPQERRLQAKGLYILCDGMGGHESGEVASALAVETLQSYFEQHWQDTLPTEKEISQAIAQTNDVIYNTNQADERSGSGRMGTTLVLLLLQGTQAVVAHVGDSRLYRYSRRLGLQQVTCDHEVGQREMQRGVEPAIAYARPDAYQLTQALGPRDSHNIRPSVDFLEFSEDTLLLLCSDGLSDNELLDTHVSSHIEPLLTKQTDLEVGLGHLIDLANEQNGHDNITAIAIRIKVKPDLDKLKQSS